jgi:hypothetical protein
MPQAPGDNDSMDAWTARMPERVGSPGCAEGQVIAGKTLLVRMVVRVAIQLLQVFPGQFILWIDFEGACKVQSRLL